VVGGYLLHTAGNERSDFGFALYHPSYVLGGICMFPPFLDIVDVAGHFPPHPPRHFPCPPSSTFIQFNVGRCRWLMVPRATPSIMLEPASFSWISSLIFASHLHAYSPQLDVFRSRPNVISVGNSSSGSNGDSDK